MAAILPAFQQYQDYRQLGQSQIGVHGLRLVSSSDTFTVPFLSHATSGESAQQLRRSTDVSVTVTHTDRFTVTVAGGSPGDEVIIVTMHPNRADFGPEDVGTGDSGLETT